MRAIVRLTAQRDAEYQHDYHHKLRGRLWRALEPTPFSDLHGVPDALPFAYSNPFPRKDYDEGDEANLVVASPHPELISALVDQLETNPEFNIGEMPFRVDTANAFGVDVGEPMVSGTLQCSTGVYLKLDENHCKRFDIDRPNDEARISWVPDHGLRPFYERIAENTAWKDETLHDEYDKRPSTFSDLFNEVHLGDTYPITLPVTEGQTETFLATQARFEYRVRDETHRRWLNMLLDTGIGCRNPLGFGMVNITEKTHPVNGDIL